MIIDFKNETLEAINGRKVKEYAIWRSDSVNGLNENGNIDFDALRKMFKLADFTYENESADLTWCGWVMFRGGGGLLRAKQGGGEVWCDCDIIRANKA